MNNLKVEGKVSDWCPKCKNCKAITWNYNGKKEQVTEIECEDPYDGMVKTLNADSDICCSMFKPNPPCEKCERFDGTYCHSPNGIFVSSYMAFFNQPGDCSLYEEKKEKGPHDEISCLQHELEMEKLRMKIHQLEKEKADHLKGIDRLKKSQEKLQNQVKNLQTTNKASYKREEKLEDKVRKLERRLLEESKRFARLDSEFLIPIAHVLYPREAKICKPYPEVITDIKELNKNSTYYDRYKTFTDKVQSLLFPDDHTYEFDEIIKEINDLKKSRDSWRDRYYEVRYALRKDEALDESISCVRDIPSDVEMIEDLKKRAADSDYCKEKSELLEEKLKKANDLADSWQRDYEFVHDRLIHPIHDILYPDNPSRDINVTDLLNTIKDFKVYADENESMYEEIKKLRDMYVSRGNEIDHLLSENKELGARVKYWSNKATKRAGERWEAERDRDKWRSLYNSLSEICADYDKRCKEECEKKYRDEISKLQNIVTEKEVELKKRLKDNVYLTQTKFFDDTVIEKNKKLNQTISDQEITIKVLLLTIKEMCKEDETNE